MSSPEALLSACTTNQEEQQRLIERASSALSLWDNWLKPVSPETETGDDPAYDDNFQLMREEINKLSGTDPELTPPTGHEDDVLSLEAEAMEKGDSEGPEAAFAWLQSRPGMDTPRQRWLVRLLMARVAEQYGRNDMALHLLGELTASAPQLTLGDWEPGLLFEVQARRLKLLRMKASRSESDKTRLMPEMDALLAGLIAVDPARAMVLCG